MPRPARPDFLIVGAPKAGTTAVHSALALHPQVFVSQPKEPKYWLCDDAPPPAWNGPGDAHSQQEWMWRREDYFRLFEGAAARASPMLAKVGVPSRGVLATTTSKQLPSPCLQGEAGRGL